MPECARFALTQGKSPRKEREKRTNSGHLSVHAGQILSVFRKTSNLEEVGSGMGAGSSNSSKEKKETRKSKANQRLG